MINGKTYYRILGLLTSAEDLVIRAAYRSLSNKYHPDKWTGDKTLAHERMQEINAAYETLGDVAKRQRYDDELKRQGKYDDVADLDDDTKDFEEVYTEHSEPWAIALRFYPELNALHEKLRHINSSLAYTFKTVLIERKNYTQASELAAQMETAFLARYFGKNQSIVDLAKILITHNARSAVRELNRIVSVMGDSVTPSQVKQVLRRQYPEVFEALGTSEELRELLGIVRDNSFLSLSQALRILDIAGVNHVDSKSDWWDGTVYDFTWVDGTKQRMRSREELVWFIRTNVLPRYK